MASAALLSHSPDPKPNGITSWMSSNHFKDNGKLLERSYNTITGKPMQFMQQSELRTPPRESRSQKQSRSFKRRKTSHDMKGSGSDSEPSFKERTGASHRARLKLDKIFGKENERIVSSPNDRLVPDLDQLISNIVREEAERISILEQNTNREKDQKTLLCYTCVKTVGESEFNQHLFFGEIKCGKCCRKLYSCRQFRQARIDGIANHETCEHSYKYRISSSEYLSSKLRDDLLNSPEPCQKLQDGMSSYISALKALEKEEPWKHAIRQCKKYLKKSSLQTRQSSVNITQTSCFSLNSTNQENHENEAATGEFTLSQAYSLEHLESAVEYEVANDYPEELRASAYTAHTDSRKDKKDEHSADPCRDVHNVEPSVLDLGNSLTHNDRAQTHPSRRKKPRSRCKPKSKSSTASKDKIKASTSQKFLKTPENGHYLVLRQAIEECPMCYTELCATMFTVNVETFLLTTVCSGCDLTIYIVFTPPDGSAPKISIVTEEKSSEEEQQNSKKEEKAGKDKIRIRNFFKR